MMIFMEILIFLSTVLPLFHIINALISKRRNPYLLSRDKKFSILIPCYNEEYTVALSVNALLNMDYDNYEAIYINDGSNDGTLRALNGMLRLYIMEGANAAPGHTVYRSSLHPNFFVIDKPKEGKSDALNAGLALAANELIVTLDADSVLEKNALRIMAGTFEDPDVVAAGGSVHIIQGYITQGSRRAEVKPLLMLQILEYIKGFYIYKMSLSMQRAVTIVSGAFGVFRKEILMLAGGYRRTLGEDVDITIRIQKMIHKTRKKILFIPKALCFTQCPENWRDLKNQRMRWQKGFIDCVVHHWRFLFKTFLYKSFSFHFLVEAMVVGLSSCLLTIFTYVFTAVLAFGDVSILGVFAAYYAFCIAFDILYSISALAVSMRCNRYPERIFRKVWLAVALNILFYRYFNLIMFLAGTLSYFWTRKSKYDWNKVTRVKRDYSPAVQEGA
ncbi:MAG: glycosyltransferase family 2 protein [Burkholderiales bacterium]